MRFSALGANEMTAGSASRRSQQQFAQTTTYPAVVVAEEAGEVAVTA